ncbi:protein stoned-B-like [Limulus polyphemus]|uniref:Protein stoned-B-like n=1 Tax=Limulus polyphemus TaxID=6850 RepID=A0ABM1S8P0_LIMPO|nr:protein stoned-B-like [Limulus polyphemus]XP_022239994.1 protein stoned-B-like [Limulus polyphemus]XP_022239995.1 protein stoned-B-like [Limulus polyphemus]
MNFIKKKIKGHKKGHDSEEEFDTYVQSQQSWPKESDDQPQERNTEEWQFFQQLTQKVQETLQKSQTSLSKLKDESAITDLDRPEYLDEEEHQSLPSGAKTWINFEEDSSFPEDFDISSSDQDKSVKSSKPPPRPPPPKLEKTTEVSEQETKAFHECQEQESHPNLEFSLEEEFGLSEELAKEIKTFPESPKQESHQQLEFSLEEEFGFHKDDASTSLNPNVEFLLEDENKERNDPFDTTFVDLSTDLSLVKHVTSDSTLIETQNDLRESSDPFDTSFVNTFEVSRRVCTEKVLEDKESSVFDVDKRSERSSEIKYNAFDEKNLKSVALETVLIPGETSKADIETMSNPFYSESVVNQSMGPSVSPFDVDSSSHYKAGTNPFDEVPSNSLGTQNIDLLSDTFSSDVSKAVKEQSQGVCEKTDSLFDPFGLDSSAHSSVVDGTLDSQSCSQDKSSSVLIFGLPPETSQGTEKDTFDPFFEIGDDGSIKDKLIPSVKDMQQPILETLDKKVDPFAIADQSDFFGTQTTNEQFNPFTSDGSKESSESAWHVLSQPSSNIHQSIMSSNMWNTESVKDSRESVADFGRITTVPKESQVTHTEMTISSVEDKNTDSFEFFSPPKSETKKLPETNAKNGDKSLFSNEAFDALSYSDNFPSSEKDDQPFSLSNETHRESNISILSSFIDEEEKFGKENIDKLVRDSEHNGEAIFDHFESKELGIMEDPISKEQKPPIEDSATAFIVPDKGSGGKLADSVDEKSSFSQGFSGISDFEVLSPSVVSQEKNSLPYNSKREVPPFDDMFGQMPTTTKTDSQLVSSVSEFDAFASFPDVSEQKSTSIDPFDTSNIHLEPVKDSVPYTDTAAFEAFAAKFEQAIEKFDTDVTVDDEFDPFAAPKGSSKTDEDDEKGFGTVDLFDPFLSITKPHENTPIKLPPKEPSRDSFDDDDTEDFSVVIKPKMREKGELSSLGLEPPPLLPPPPKTPTKSPSPQITTSRFNPFDKDSNDILIEGFGQEKFEEASVQSEEPPPALGESGVHRTDSTETPPTPLFDEDTSQPLEVFPPKFEGDGWEMMLRQPSKKKITGNRFWKKVFLKLSENSILQLFNKQEDNDPFQELPLQACYSLSEVGTQQYDVYGKIFTVKLQYIFYRERVGVRPGQLSKMMQGQITSVGQIAKLGLPLEHSPQISQLLKLGSQNYQDIKMFIQVVEDALFHLSVHRDRALTYKTEEVQVTVHDEFRVDQDKDGKVLKQLARVRIFFLAFITGMPDIEVGLNDIERQGKEVVGRHDIIPVVTEEWIRLEDCEFHSCVLSEEFENNRIIKLHPPDACLFELMRFRIRPPKNRELPLQVKTQMTVTTSRVEIRCDLLVPGFHSRKHGQVPCQDVQIRFPIPECWIYLFRVEKHSRYGSLKSAARKPGKIKGLERIIGTAQSLDPSLIEVSAGQAKYEHALKAVVWRIPRLPKEGQGAYTTQLFLLKLNLTSFDQIPDTFSQYVDVEFIMPATTVSHTTVRSVSVTNPNPPEKYVRYLSKHEYKVEISFCFSQTESEYISAATTTTTTTTVQPTTSENIPESGKESNSNGKNDTD